jgi:octopine/nopaline transport system substrate-binding protein
MTMLRSILMTTTVLALTCAGARAELKHSIVIATEGAYAPWNLTGPNGAIVGFEPDLVQYICDRAKLECKIVAQDWNAMIPGLLTGNSDMIMDAISITPEREKTISFSPPYAHTKATFLAAKDSKFANVAGTGTTLVTNPALDNAGETLKTLRQAFRGATIGLQEGTVYSDFINKNFGDIAKIRTYPANAERMLDLQAGRIDLAFEDTVVLTPEVEKAAGDLAFTGPAFGGTLFDEGSGFGFRPADTELRSAFANGIKAAIADGTIRSLGQKWLKTDVSP